MSRRFFVYDITTPMEDFVASFADPVDAKEWGQKKFGDSCYVSDVSLHEKIKLGIAKKKR